jgi:hypothetical protein
MPKGSPPATPSDAIVFSFGGAFCADHLKWEYPLRLFEISEII